MKNSSIGARETIAKRNKTRIEIKQLQEDLRDMQQLYEKEKGRKKVGVAVKFLKLEKSFLTE